MKRNRTLLGFIFILSLTVIMLASCTASTATSTATSGTTTTQTTVPTTTTTNYDGTYTGKFIYMHPVDDAAEWKNVQWVEDSFTLTLKFKTNSVFENRVVILEITDISCSEPKLGSGIPTENPNKTYQSIAYLPFNPATQLTDKGFYYINVYFTNGSLEIASQAEHEGDLIASADGATLANSPGNTGSLDNRTRPWIIRDSSGWVNTLLRDSWPRWGWYPVSWSLTKISS